MNILIIGGTGLISTSISRQLLEAGHNLTLFNRGQTESRVDGKYEHIRGDRNNRTVFEEKIAAAGPFDCVIDMVCYKPEQAESTIRALTGKTGQLIFCSTVDVYTKPPATFPVLESHPRESLSDYGREKAACEDVFMAAHHAATSRSPSCGQPAPMAKAEPSFILLAVTPISWIESGRASP